MTDCAYCDWIATKKNLIYEDEKTAVALSPQPAAAGHLIVLPRTHYTIFEQVPADVNAALGVVSNKMSIIQFETLQASGTNLLIQNGADAGQTMPHFSIHLIPRFENDHINFAWKSRPLDEEQMAVVELGLKEQLSGGEEHAAKPHDDHSSGHHAPHRPHPVLKYPERIP